MDSTFEVESISSTNLVVLVRGTMRKVLGVLVISDMLAIASVLLIGFDALTNAAVNAPHLTATPSATPIRAYLPAVAMPELPVTNTITGTVVINGGACCAGGMVGETITLGVQFAATSAAGPVTRLRTGSRNSLSQTSWKAFAPVLFYALKINTINWTGLEICAQFRDAHDHVSVPVCDDISVEGMPAP